MNLGQRVKQAYYPNIMLIVFNLGQNVMKWHLAHREKSMCINRVEKQNQNLKNNILGKTLDVFGVKVKHLRLNLVLKL